jgi:hypothetical protein
VKLCLLRYLNKCSLWPRYLSACETCWRPFGFDIHVREPSVDRLAVHLPNMNRIIYHESDRVANIVDNPNRYRTVLTEWLHIVEVVCLLISLVTPTGTAY